MRTQAWSRAGRRGESGVVAVVVAITAILLVSICALVVDLGHAYVQKNAIQKRADFAALAGGAGDDLPVTATGVTCNYGTAGRNTDQAIVDAAAYLNQQLGEVLVTPSQLVDCNLDNGEAGFGRFVQGSCPGGTCLTANKNQLTVISQPSHVDFGFARVMGFNSVDVAGRATVEIKTPLLKTLPFYAFTGCDFGNQTIAQPTNGHAAAGIQLKYGSDSNAAELNSLVTNPATTPASVPLGVADPDDSLVVQATAGTLAGVTQVGFFLSGTVSEGPEPVTIDNSKFTVASGVLTISDLPTEVTSVEAYWYVRVKIGSTWSPVFTGPSGNPTLRALPLVVGTPSLTCGQGSSAGNFGTLDLPPDPPVPGINDSTKQIAVNTIQGLSHGLAPFPSDKTPGDYLCQSNPDGTINWPADGANCLPVKTGLDSNAAEMGFITGVGSFPKGLLEKDALNSDTYCPNDYPASTSHTTVVQGRTINDDVLTCYFTNDSVTVSQVSSPGYSGAAVIDQSIYDSPRFVRVPVLGVQPDNGNSKRYVIMDFRPGFITDQPPAATRLTGTPIRSGTVTGNNATGTSNGITYDHGALNSLNVVFLNPKALPNPPLDPDGKYIPYLGSGDKVTMMVD